MSNNMFRTSKQIIRIALLTMLFQILAPSFMPMVARETHGDKDIAFHTNNNSMADPMLLQEQDEKEDGDFSPSSSPAPLLDLTSHTFNLVASHKKKYSQFTEDEQGFSKRPISIHFCTFLI